MMLKVKVKSHPVDELPAGLRLLHVFSSAHRVTILIYIRSCAAFIIIWL
jgi:hypothetical protein